MIEVRKDGLMVDVFIPAALVGKSKDRRLYMVQLGPRRFIHFNYDEVPYAVEPDIANMNDTTEAFYLLRMPELIWNMAS